MSANARTDAQTLGGVHFGCHTDGLSGLVVVWVFQVCLLQLVTCVFIIIWDLKQLT